MTSYSISVGYNSGCPKEDVSRELEAVAKEICEDKDSLVSEVKAVEGFDLDPEFAEYFCIPCQDLTICIESGHDGHAKVVMMASGGGVSRDYKEASRRAFCRLVMKKMHAKNMEVNVTVS